MHYLIEQRDRVYVKGYWFLSFAKNIGKNLSNKYSQKPLGSAIKTTADVITTASKTAIQKTTEAAVDLIDNKIADKIKSVSEELHSKKSSQNELKTWNRNAKRKIYISKKRQQIFDKLRLM